jgi:hypothetical protein
MMWIFRLLNTNFIHNLLNVLIAVNGFVLYAGCNYNEAGQATCAQAWIPAEMAVAMIAVAGPLKLVMNVVRDGIPGLFKQQPPVVSEITKTEVKVVATAPKK